MAETNKIPRRTFLSGLGLIVAAGVAVKVAGTAPSDKVQDAAAAPEPDGTGYRLTEHVKKYYRTTTI